MWATDIAWWNSCQVLLALNPSNLFKVSTWPTDSQPFNSRCFPASEKTSDSQVSKTDPKSNIPCKCFQPSQVEKTFKPTFFCGPIISFPIIEILHIMVNSLTWVTYKGYLVTYFFERHTTIPIVFQKPSQLQLSPGFAKGTWFHAPAAPAPFLVRRPRWPRSENPCGNHDFYGKTCWLVVVDGFKDWK